MAQFVISYCHYSLSIQSFIKAFIIRPGQCLRDVLLHLISFHHIVLLGVHIVSPQPTLLGHDAFLRIPCISQTNIFCLLIFRRISPTLWGLSRGLVYVMFINLQSPSFLPSSNCLLALTCFASNFLPIVLVFIYLTSLRS